MRHRPGIRARSALCAALALVVRRARQNGSPSGYRDAT